MPARACWFESGQGHQPARGRPRATEQLVRLAEREQILAATRKVVADKGFRALRVSDVAKCSGASTGTVQLPAAKDVREMLAVIANQVAVSLQNGYLYKQMETMATTDGLTGLTNHRTFQDRFRAWEG